MEDKFTERGKLIIPPKPLEPIYKELGLEKLMHDMQELIILTGEIEDIYGSMKHTIDLIFSTWERRTKEGLRDKLSTAKFYEFDIAIKEEIGRAKRLLKSIEKNKYRIYRSGTQLP